MIEVGFTELKFWNLVLQFGRIWSRHDHSFQTIIQQHHELVTRPLPNFQISDAISVRQDALLHMFALVLGQETTSTLNEIRSRFHSVLFYSFLQKELNFRKEYHT